MKRLLLIASLIAVGLWLLPDQPAVAQVGPTMQSGNCGAGAPSNSDGNDGDLFNCTDSMRIYGPKTSGSWGARYTVVMGEGCTTAFHIDKDCDGYGVGVTLPQAHYPDPNPILGPDADDKDATINTPATMLAKYGTVNAFLTHRGYPTNRVYYLDSANGSDTNYAAHACSVDFPCKTYAVIYPVLRTGAGATLIWRAGTVTTTLVNSAPYADQPTAPIVIMAYPGERVVSNSSSQNVAPVGGGNVFYSANLVIDGFIITRPVYFGSGNGDCINGSYAVNFTMRNIESGGCYHTWTMGGGGLNHVVEDSVMYDSSSHIIYPTSNSLGAGGGGSFDCSGWTWQPLTYNAFFNLIIRRNVFPNGGNGGLEALHLNAPICGFQEYNNIVWGGGGAGLGFQMGPQMGQVFNNIVYDNSSFVIGMNLYGCDSSGLFMEPYMLGTLCNTGTPGGAYPMSNMEKINFTNNSLWQGAVKAPTNPGSQDIAEMVNLADTSDGRSVDGFNKRFVKNINFYNNIMVSYDKRGQGTTFPHFRFGASSYPDTYHIQNNVMWNGYSDHSSADVAWFYTPDAIGCYWSYSFCIGLGPTRGSGSALVPDGTRMSFADLSTYNTANNSGNVWGDPLFTDVQLPYQYTPEFFNFNLQSGSPASTAGLASVAPKFDIRMRQRSATTPSVGAIEYNSSPLTIPWYILTTVSAGAGKGWITGQNSTSCMTDTFLSGTAITCLAVPVSGSTFTGWSGTGSAASCSGTGYCTFTITANSTVTATFATGGPTGIINNVWCEPSTIPVGGVAKCHHTVAHTASSNALTDYTAQGGASAWTVSDSQIASFYLPYNTKAAPEYVTGKAPGTVTITHGGTASLRASTSLTVVAVGYKQTIATGSNPIYVAGSVCGGLLAPGVAYTCTVATTSNNTGGTIASVVDTCGSTITQQGPSAEVHSGTMPNFPCSITANSAGTKNSGVTFNWAITGHGTLYGAYCNEGANVYPLGTQFFCLAIPTPGESVSSIVNQTGAVAGVAGPQTVAPKTGPEIYGTAANATNTVNFTATGTIPPPVITTTTLPNGRVGIAYSGSLSGAQGTTPYTWSVSAGTLCVGMSLNSSAGTITGTPTTPQICNFTVTLTDSAAQTASKALTITVAASGTLGGKHSGKMNGGVIK